MAASSEDAIVFMPISPSLDNRTKQADQESNEDLSAIIVGCIAPFRPGCDPKTSAPSGKVGCPGAANGSVSNVQGTTLQDSRQNDLKLLI